MAWFSRKRRILEAGLRVVETKRNEAGTYEVLACDDEERAKAYLRAQRVTKERYYVIVETPDGNWGADVNGLFLENLRPWQLDISAADCKGMISGTIDGNLGIEGAARGWADNYVLEVHCGRCGREWLDGVRYRDDTLVRCPGCGARNLIDSRGFTFTRHS